MDSFLSSQVQQQVTDQVNSQVQQVSQSVASLIDDAKQQINTLFKSTTKIVIVVGEPMTKESGLSKHTIYNIKGTDHLGSFEVYRRFSDFYSLREYMVQNWPCIFIPPIPVQIQQSFQSQYQDKQVGQGNDILVIQERKRHLDFFCRSVAQVRFLYESDEFSQVFLRSQAVDISKVIQNFSKPSTAEIIVRYRRLFPIDSKENHDQVVQISAAQGALSKSLRHLILPTEQSAQLAQSRRVLNEQKMLMLTQILPDYEKKCLLEYFNGDESKLLISNPFALKLQEQIQRFRDHHKSNPFDEIYDLMKIDYRETEALIFAIVQRDESYKYRQRLENKLRDQQSTLANLVQGKQNLTTIASSVMKSKDQAQLKLETKITENQKEIELLSELNVILTAMLVQIEIPRFKNQKKTNLSRVFREVTQKEFLMLKEEQELLTSLSQQIKGE